MATLALFQLEPYCSRECGAGILSALSKTHNIELITRHDLTLDHLSRFDMLIMPGGQGDANDFQQLLKTRKPVLHSYLDQGGAYLGICMGAYWADSRYFDLIGETRCIQYITRPKAEIRRSFPTLARAKWQGQSEKFYFYDGCAFIGADPNVETYATYANGDPMAVIKGNVGLIGCHLESELNWYHAHTLKPAWHGLAHHRLLAEFTDDLLHRSPLKPTYIDLNSIETETITDQDRFKAALEEIERETSMFTQGTFKKINAIARRALKLKGG